ncbi:peptide ABC transporter ATP-binding protein [candidate division KSB3 bacterium]|uniref:Peptide ABC transporter ATP-binding protein n=1 Tax=candidate division KSB3 bacterium TaxID=2044937 RepID=A0A2G6K6Q3_9BACT|nr:MAG: peptide ABC transporter ATP-binding protein [candidate division KSB3 bacterium]
MNQSKPILEVNNLKIHFNTFEGTAQVVDGVSFSLKKGDTLGLVGETGCGKSITAKAILRLLPTPPTQIAAGEIVFEGRNILKMGEPEIQQIRGNQIAMIFQDPVTFLNPVFTVEHQMVDVILAHQKTRQKFAKKHGGAGNGPIIDKEAARARAIELLQHVKIPQAAQRIRSYPHEFSGGMRQRVLIAMALSGSPQILIADEPTTALDVTIQAQILKLMKELVQEHHNSVLLISHDLGVVAKLCQRVAVMYAGNIVETCPTATIFTEPLHPYTKGLLKSIPIFSSARERLQGIRGNIPNFVTPPSGCRFHPRCSEAMDICRQKKPELSEMNPGHQIRCFLYPSTRSSN